MFEPPRYMTVAQAAEQLLKAIDNRRKDENGKQLKCKQQCNIAYSTLYVSYSLSYSLSPLFSLSLSLPPSRARFDGKMLTLAANSCKQCMYNSN